MMTNKTPLAMGYRWPAEWEPHQASWVSWPHRQESWPGKFAPVPGQFAGLVRNIAQFEPVHVLAGGTEVLSEAERWLDGLPNITLHDIPTDDAWCRDHGPMFLSGGSGDPPALIDWEYNAWGGKYPPFDQDNAVPSRIAERLGYRRFRPGLVLEGGAVETNGCGTLLTTTSCLLAASRNPQLSQSDVEDFWAAYLGISHVLWLKRGDLAGDDTDGHIDQLARFVSPSTVVAAWEADPADINYQPLIENFRVLQSMADQSGRRLDVIPLLMPRPKYVGDHRLPASYCNFYIANGAVFVPQFEDRRDSLALETLAQVFPDRQVIGLPALDLVWGLGAFHCLTQQQPAQLQTQAGTLRAKRP